MEGKIYVMGVNNGEHVCKEWREGCINAGKIS